MKNSKKTVAKLLLLLGFFLGITEKAMEAPVSSPHTSDEEERPIRSFAAAAEPDRPIASASARERLRQKSVRKESAAAAAVSQYSSDDLEELSAAAAVAPGWPQFHETLMPADDGYDYDLTEALDNSLVENYKKVAPVAPRATELKTAGQKVQPAFPEASNRSIHKEKENSDDEQTAVAAPLSQEELSMPSFAAAAACASAPGAGKSVKKNSNKFDFKEYLKRIIQNNPAEILAKPSGAGIQRATPTAAAAAGEKKQINDSNFFEHLAETLNHLYSININPEQASIVFNDIDINILKMGGINSLDHFKKLLIQYWDIDGIRSSQKCVLTDILITSIKKDGSGKGYCYELSVAPKIAALLNKPIVGFGEKITARDVSGKKAPLDFDISIGDVLVECKNKKYGTYIDQRENIQQCRRRGTHKEMLQWLDVLFKDDLCADIDSFKRHKIIAACNSKKYIVVFSHLPEYGSKEFINELKESGICHIVIPITEQCSSATGESISQKSLTKETIEYLNAPKTDLEDYIKQFTDFIKKSQIKMIKVKKNELSCKTKKDLTEEDFRQILIECSPEELQILEKAFEKNVGEKNTPRKRGVIKGLGSPLTPEKAGETAKKPTQPNGFKRKLALQFSECAVTSSDLQDTAASPEKLIPESIQEKEEATAASHAHLPLANIEKEEENLSCCCIS